MNSPASPDIIAPRSVTATSPTQLGARLRQFAHCLAIISTIALMEAPASAQLLDAAFDGAWVTDGIVHAVFSRGDTTYVGGEFTHVSPNTGTGVPIDAVTAQPVANYPRVNGEVLAVAPDGAGGWYVGGAFTSVGTTPRGNLAHILPGGALDPTWNPMASDRVRAIAVGGGVVYVGGDFTTVGGQMRNRIAALDPSTGAATPWNPGASAQVSALLVDGSTIYAGGEFTVIGSAVRNRIAALDATTGASTTWNPNCNGPVRAIALMGSTVFIGGRFGSAGGQGRNNAAAIDATTALALPWNPDVQGGNLTTVLTLAATGSVVYAGGDFSTIGGQPRPRLAALDATTGLATSWNPQPLNLLSPELYVDSIALLGSTLYVGGSFSQVDGQPRNNVAAVDAVSGAVLPWNPNAHARVWAVAPTATTIYVGGSFASLGGIVRNHLAAFDAATGVPTNWNPGSDDVVQFISSMGDDILVGGTFSSIGGQTRNGLAAIDEDSGVATTWNPDVTGAVLAAVVADGIVYAGGAFSQVGGQSRNSLAAIDAVTGTPTSWNPGSSDPVRSLTLLGTTLYVGGDFNTLGGQTRPRLGAVNITTGTATGWDPQVSTFASGTTVHALAATGNTVFAGGKFLSVGGQNHVGLAAIDASTGTVTSWYPPSLEFQSPLVRSLAIVGTTIHVAGEFDTGMTERPGLLVSFDITTGAASPWMPVPGRFNTRVNSLSINGPRAYVGGSFRTMGGAARARYAQFNDASVPTAAADWNLYR